MAGEVCQALARRGIEAVLTGGAVVAIYSRNEYMSWDLDFVVRGKDSDIAAAMSGIGFRKGGGRHFERKGTPYIVEFLNPPLAVGNLLVSRYARLRTSRGTLLMEKTTHCVMDRLAAFYHWKDRQGLDQAVLVAKRQRVQMREIERWSAGEGHSEGYHAFRLALLASRRQKRR